MACYSPCCTKAGPEWRSYCLEGTQSLSLGTWLLVWVAVMAGSSLGRSVLEGWRSRGVPLYSLGFHSVPATGAFFLIHPYSSQSWVVRRSQLLLSMTHSMAFCGMCKTRDYEFLQATGVTFNKSQHTETQIREHHTAFSVVFNCTYNLYPYKKFSLLLVPPLLKLEKTLSLAQKVNQTVKLNAVNGDGRIIRPWLAVPRQRAQKPGPGSSFCGAAEDALHKPDATWAQILIQPPEYLHLLSGVHWTVLGQSTGFRLWYPFPGEQKPSGQDRFPPYLQQLIAEIRNMWQRHLENAPWNNVQKNLDLACFCKGDWERKCV